MSKNDTISLNRRLLNVSESIEHLAKDGTNTFQNYKYTTEMAVSEAFRKAFIKEGILMLLDSTLNTTENGITNVDMTITLINVDDDEDRHVLNWCGQGYDKGDKGMYKAFTGGLKYFLLKTFMIPTYNDAEADHMTVLKKDTTETAPHKRTTTTNKTARIQPANGVAEGNTNNTAVALKQQQPKAVKKTPILPKKSQALVKEILDYSQHPVFDTEQREKLLTWAGQEFNKAHDKSVKEAYEQVKSRITNYTNTRVDVYLRKCENSNDVIPKDEMDRKIAELKDNLGVVEWLS